MTDSSSRHGPIDDATWPTQLPAHVITPSDNPHAHGFDVQSDIARHYTPSDAAFLALTGELPEAEVSTALNVVLVFIAPTHIAEAPTHAAALARLCGARPSAVIAIAATALAEQARALFDDHSEVVNAPERYTARNEGDRAATARLREALGEFVARVPELARDLPLDAAILATLFACGLRTREQVETIITTARLPFACAEAFAWKPGDLRAYPMDTPHFEYQNP